ncbi:MAG TPA: RDD family protein [Candidatus Brachybacterium merdigallinarum]|nr:RDD family protein [Candidatus Brachybacterium merdigallinarum]
MSQTRYCSTCGNLLTAGAAICGECGARYQESPYERRATDAPGAWSQAPKARSRDLGPSEEEETPNTGIELISAESLRPPEPGATALRSQEQYDQVMATQSPMNQPATGQPGSMPGGYGSPSGAPQSANEPGGALAEAPELEAPLDGCAPASPLKRFLAALIDSVISSLVLVPLTVAVLLLVLQEEVTLLAQILVGVGAALPAAYAVLLLWLIGSKGVTPGKAIVGLRIAATGTGAPIGFLRALGRVVFYNLFPLLMAISIFFDPKKHLRGFHDRVIGSVVVDIKAGRHPFTERPDDFERAGAEHYLGAPSVAVTTHDNLLSTPGAAWSSESAVGTESSAAGAAPGQDPWSPPSSAPASPYAPPSANEAPAASPAGGSPWSPPPTAPSSQPAHAPQPEPFSQPDQFAQPDQFSQQAPSAPEAPPAQSGWGAPPAHSWGPQGTNPPAAAESAAPQQFSARPQQQPASPLQDPQQPPAPQFSAPPQQAPAPQPAPQPQASPAPAPQQPSAPEPAPAPAWAPPVGGPPPEAPAAPLEQTGPDFSAWNDDEVDEQTRVAGAEEADLGDLEQTRVSAVVPPTPPTVRVTADDGTERVVTTALVIGRNPSGGQDEALFVLKDDTRSVSKTHLRVDGTGDAVTVTDLGSTNGSAIVRADGTRESLVPNSATVLPDGASLTIGDRTLTVEREK